MISFWEKEMKEKGAENIERFNILDKQAIKCLDTISKI